MNTIKRYDGSFKEEAVEIAKEKEVEASQIYEFIEIKLRGSPIELKCKTLDVTKQGYYQ